MNLLNGELTLAFFTLVGVLIGYLLNHFLTLREKSVIREFEVRKEGKEFYLPLYGFIAQLADLVIGYVTAQKKGKAQLIVKEGYNYLDSNEVLKRYNQAYEDFTKFLGKSRTSGFELFIPLELSSLMEDILGYSTLFYEQHTWDFKTAEHFAKKTDYAMKRMEELLGLKRTSLKETLLKVGKLLLHWGY